MELKADIFAHPPHQCYNKTTSKQDFKEKSYLSMKGGSATRALKAPKSSCYYHKTQ